MSYHFPWFHKKKMSLILALLVLCNYCVSTVIASWWEKLKTFPMMQSTVNSNIKTSRNQSTGTHLSPFHHEFWASFRAHLRHFCLSLVRLQPPINSSQYQSTLILQRQNEKYKAGANIPQKPPPTPIRAPLCSCMHVKHLRYHLPGCVRRSVLSFNC